MTKRASLTLGPADFSIEGTLALGEELLWAAPAKLALSG
jgi:hypothetical protein